MAARVKPYLPRSGSPHKRQIGQHNDSNCGEVSNGIEMSVRSDIVRSVQRWEIPDSGRLAGVVTTAELVKAGLTKPAIRRLTRRGVLTAVRRGAYARTDLLARMPGREELRARVLQITAAVAVVGGDAVASHQDAAIVLGVDLLEHLPADLITVSRPDGREGMLAGRPMIRVRSTALPQEQVTVRGGVPVTTAARTVVDLARTTSFRSGVVVADSALHRRLTSRAELDGVIATCSRWPGIERARRVAAFGDGRSESPFESISRVAFRDGGLPPPELQVWVGGDNGPVGRVDFLWRRYATIAEADGALKYADPDRARRQLRRDADLREAGFEVVHFGWAELTLTPGQVVRAITTAFARSDSLRSSGRRAGLAG